MGEVFLARSARLGYVAIKTLAAPLARPRFRERLEREVATIISIKHPNVVPIHDVVDEEIGELYLVMDYVAEGNLADYVEKNGPLPWQLGLTLILQVARALLVAHRNDVLHRDVKPSNMLVRQAEDDFWVMLSDFGIAQVIGARGSRRPGRLYPGRCATRHLNSGRVKHHGLAMSSPSHAPSFISCAVKRHRLSRDR